MKTEHELDHISSSELLFDFLFEELHQSTLKLDRIYRLPRPLKSDRELRRWLHQDMQAASDVDLWREHQRLRLRLIFDDQPGSWLLERLSRIRNEKADRRARGSIGADA